MIYYCYLHKAQLLSIIIIIITCTKFKVIIFHYYLHKVHSYYLLLLPPQSSQLISIIIIISYTKFTVLLSILLQKRTCGTAIRFRTNPKQNANSNMEQ